MAAVVCMIILGLALLVAGGTRRLVVAIILGLLLDVGIVLVVLGTAETLGSPGFGKRSKTGRPNSANGKPTARRGGRKP